MTKDKSDKPHQSSVQHIKAKSPELYASPERNKENNRRSHEYPANKAYQSFLLVFTFLSFLRISSLRYIVNVQFDGYNQLNHVRSQHQNCENI